MDYMLYSTPLCGQFVSTVHDLGCLLRHRNAFHSPTSLSRSMSLCMHYQCLCVSLWYACMQRWKVTQLTLINKLSRCFLMKKKMLLQTEIQIDV